MPVNQDLLILAPLSQLLVVLGAGLATSLTPCVYPLIPITLSLFGATSSNSKLKAFFLASSYVLGIALTYTALGVFSAYTGVLFGSFLGNPWVVLALLIFLILLALFSLDLIQFNFIYKFQSSASQVGGTGALGAFLMGSVSGIVAGPCVGPILIVILGFAAHSRDLLWGGILLFTYSLGLGFPFLILGTFSGLIKNLPRSGSWLNLIKFVTSAALLLVAVRLAWPFISFAADVKLALSPAQALTALSFLLALAWLAYKRELKWLKLASALAIALLISPGVQLGQPAIELKWSSNLEESLSKAQTQQKYSMLDIYADWCAACKELDEKTFSDPQVALRLKELSLIRLDFTLQDERSEALSAKYQIQGLPCVMFFDKNGNEIGGSRITGFVEPEEFLKHLQTTLDPNSTSH